MANYFNYKLNINENFRKLIPRLSSAELLQLEQSIIQNGCLEPIKVWNGTIIDGHNRYEICIRHQIKFVIQNVYFTNEYEAYSWICENELMKKNITEETRKYLIGKRYHFERDIIINSPDAMTRQGLKNLKSSFDKTSSITSERLGDVYNISHFTVEKYANYSHIVDELSKIVPELTDKILSNSTKISHENLRIISGQSLNDIVHISEYISEKALDRISYYEICNIIKQTQQQKNESKLLPIGSIKNMPAYDPDAEISSLALTIPSWISSINRTRSVANLSLTSNNGRSKIMKELRELKLTVETFLSSIEEEI